MLKKHLLSALVLVFSMAGSASATTIDLYASFSFTEDLDPARSIPLTVGTWHVGSIGGPLATASDLHTVLSNMSSLTIGGTMQGLQLGPFGTQSEGFALTNPDLGGAASDDLGACCAFNWSGVDIWSAVGGAPGGLLAALTFNLTPTFVSVREGTIFTGDLDAAFGNALTFRFALLASAQNPFRELDSGIAILSATVPEPATLLLLGSGLAVGSRLLSRRSRLRIVPGSKRAGG